MAASLSVRITTAELDSAPIIQILSYFVLLTVWDILIDVMGIA